MFLETYRRAMERLLHLKSLLAEYDRVTRLVTRDNARQLLGPPIQELLAGLHTVTDDDEVHRLCAALTEWQELNQRLRVIQLALRQLNLLELFRCPVCTAGHTEEQSSPKGAIDRPAFPRPELLVTPETVTSFMRALRPWLSEAILDLIEEIPDSYKSLPPRPDRYTIADHVQVRNLSQWFSDAQDIATEWDALIHNEGPEWFSDRVGLQRFQLLERAKAIYIAVCNPDVGDGSGHRGLLGLFGSFLGGSAQ